MGEIKELRREILELQQEFIKFRVELSALLTSHANRLMSRADTLLPAAADEKEGDVKVVHVRHSKTAIKPTPPVQPTGQLCAVCGKPELRRHRHKQ